MRSVHDQLRQRLLHRAGLAENPITIELLQQTQWSHRFGALMRARLVMGFFRYGPNRDPQKPRFNNVSSAIERLALYLETGNQEHLVDAANLCMVEFMLPGSHPAPCWEPEDDGAHVQEVRQ